MTKNIIRRPIAELQRQPDLQIREQLSDAKVAHYAELLDDGQPPPPIIVFGNNVADGNHRIEAALRLGHLHVMVDQREGTLYDALLVACQMNGMIGLTMTRADRRRAAMLLFTTPDGYKMTNRDVGVTVGLSHPTIGDIREGMYQHREAQGELPVAIGGNLQPENVVRRAGTRSAMLDPVVAHAEAPDGWEDPGVIAATRSPVGSYTGNGSGARYAPAPAAGNTFNHVTDLVVSWRYANGNQGTLTKPQLAQLPADVRLALLDLLS